MHTLSTSETWLSSEMLSPKTASRGGITFSPEGHFEKVAMLAIRTGAIAAAANGLSHPPPKCQLRSIDPPMKVAY
ncbi:hypothetical protein TYRP_010974 [Tyrophagus putrescentiae]|nr:hypothetical protein TYRP_010974 [Tyrophagus putrescentiae]